MSLYRILFNANTYIHPILIILLLLLSLSYAHSWCTRMMPNILPLLCTRHWLWRKASISVYISFPLLSFNSSHAEFHRVYCVCDLYMYVFMPMSISPSPCIGSSAVVRMPQRWNLMREETEKKQKKKKTTQNCAYRTNAYVYKCVKVCFTSIVKYACAKFAFENFFSSFLAGWEFFFVHLKSYTVQTCSYCILYTCAHVYVYLFQCEKVSVPGVCVWMCVCVCARGFLFAVPAYVSIHI